VHLLDAIVRPYTASCATALRVLDSDLRAHSLSYLGPNFPTTQEARKPMRGIQRVLSIYCSGCVLFTRANVARLGRGIDIEILKCFSQRYHPRGMAAFVYYSCLAGPFAATLVFLLALIRATYPKGLALLDTMVDVDNDRILCVISCSSWM